jgi:hypothetical protein
MKSRNLLRTGLASLSLLASVGVASLIAWSAYAAQLPSVPPGFLPLGMSMNQLMVAVVDDAAHGVWDGANKTVPLTAREWLAVEEHTFELQAAATLTSLGGTGAADRGWVTSPAFQQWARKLNDSAIAARRAVTAKNQPALRTAGNTLVEVCEGCHKEFKPDVPTEGILHVPHYN